jgi:Domain of unknown function (DUF1772)
MGMMLVLEILAILLTAVVMSLSLAHALELPGKMRLNKEAYLTTQTIYYPGFTIGGMAEPLAVIVVFALLLSTSPAGARFWLLFLSLVALAAVQLVFWLWVQPVNKIWLKEVHLGRAGAAFFGKQSDAPRADNPEAENWRALRDRWESGHVARAVLAIISLILLTIAMTGREW